MADKFKYSGRMISGSKTSPEGHVCVFNANLCSKEDGKFWFGDIDLTADADDLKKLAHERGQNIYVLREMDARFTAQGSPRFENAVAVISPSGDMQMEAT